ncbi:hypothetical protein RB600_006977 [Gaeumannomyces tritici]
MASAPRFYSPRRGELDGDAVEPVAIVGFSLKFPQDATSPDAFWDMLAERRSAMTDVPADRWSAEGYYTADSGKPGMNNVEGAHFVKEDVSLFDAPFFSITPTEARSMDPHQRWLLECSYRAFENAGMSLEQVAGSDTTVHMGCWSGEFNSLSHHDHELHTPYFLTGTGNALIANRVSWFFDLRGSSATIDTGCSSSMVALHQACESLRSGHSSMGLVGGINLILTPHTFTHLTDLGMLNPAGKSYTFDSRAHGYARGEGIGVLVLKRLRDALRDGDCVRAVVRNTGSNQDGRTPGISQPSSAAQEDLIRTVYARAGLSLADTGYFEAHGTGTPLGDGIEARAIGAVFGPVREPGRPLYVGAVKTNLGHLEGASGVAGVIKTILVLEKGIIPPNMWFEEKNPAIEDGWNLKFPTEPTPWQTRGLRRASINSFGYGGTNVHAVLDDARSYLESRGLRGNHNTAGDPSLSLPSPPASRVIQAAPGSPTWSASSSSGGTGSDDFVILRRPGSAGGASDDMASVTSEHVDVSGGSGGGGCQPVALLPAVPRPLLFVWSTHDEDGLRRVAEAYSGYLATTRAARGEHPGRCGGEAEFLCRLAHTLASRRTRLPWRSFTVAASRSELLARLGDGKSAPSPPVRAASSPPLKVGFVFSGQGVQWHAMGRELLVYPVYRRALEEADEALQALGCWWSLIDELTKNADSSNVDNPAYSQPLCAAVQIALARLLASWGVRPASVAGHSSGEIAAAYCAGALSLRAAMKVAYFRGALSADLLVRQLTSGGGGGSGRGMMAAALSEAAANSYLERGGLANVAVGCVNSPQNVTFTGDRGQLARLEQTLKSEGVFCQLLNVGSAYHSKYMEVVALRYQKCMGSLETNGDADPATSPVMFSSTTGRRATADEVSRAEYWVKNLVSPVLFSAALSEMLREETVSTNGGEKTGVNYILEVGPHGALRRYVQEIRDALPQGLIGRSAMYDSALTRNVSATETVLNAAGRLFCAGLSSLDLGAAMASGADGGAYHGAAGREKMLVDLPEYPFNHSQGYWAESRISRNMRLRRQPRSDFLGSQVADWNPADARWRMYLKLAEHGWVRDHEVTGQLIYPAAGMLVMAIEAARQLADTGRAVAGYRLKEVVFDKALTLPAAASEGVEVQLRVRTGRVSNFTGGASGWSDFELASHGDGGWTEHCRGSIRVEYGEATATAKSAASGSWGSGSAAREKRAREERVLGEAAALDRRCSVPLDSGSLYGMIEMIGIVFGPSFRTMRDVRQSSRSSIKRSARDPASNTPSSDAVASIRVMEQRPGARPNGHQVIHPATLDGILQTVFPSLAAGDKQTAMRTLVPSFLENMWIASDICQDDPASLKAHTTARKRGLREAECTVTVTTHGGDSLLAELSGFRLTALSNGAGGGATSAMKGRDGNWRRLCYNLAWAPDVDLLDLKQAPDWFFEPLATAEATARGESLGLEEELEFLCFYYVTKALDYLDQGGTGPPAGGHLEKYVDWMRMHKRHVVSLATGGSAPTGPHAINAKSAWLRQVRDEAYVVEMMERVRETPEAPILLRLGPELPAILAGLVDPLELMFRDDVLQRLYRDGFGAKGTYAAHERLIDALAYKKPGMRILEIGAGTGGTTVPLIETLSRHGHGSESEDGTPRFEHYTFTDISPSFFEKAQEMFKDHSSRMSFKVLDIERDPIKQGFEAEGYDLIVAANVLHATKQMQVTLANTRRLLKPGGKLLLFELTNLNMLGAGFAMGLLPGWWLGTEANRKWGPLMSRTDWDAMLRSSGFTGNELPTQGPGSEKTQTISVMMSTATDHARAQKAPPASAPSNQIVIVVSERSNLQRAVAAELARYLEAGPGRTRRSDPVRIYSIAEASRTPLRDAVCVFLPEFEHPFLETMDEARFACLKQLTGAKGLLWATRSPVAGTWTPAFDLVHGFARTIREEKGEDFDFVTAALEDTRVDPASVATKLGRIIRSTGLLTSGRRGEERAEQEFVERDGVLCIGRVVEANYLNDEIATSLVPAAQRTPEMQPLQPNRPVKLTIGSLGLLDTLRFVDADDGTSGEGSPHLHIEDGYEVEIEVRACGLNFFDVMAAMGQIPEDLGIECSGVVSRVGTRVSRLKVGDRVLTAQMSSLRTMVRAPENLVYPIPEHMSFEEAATLPIVYWTAYYSLFEVARLKEGETVLIHSASGGLGQAAINMARLRRARVLATVGTAEKAAFLVREFGLREEDIFSSRDVDSFVLGVERATGGRGVDVALNSLSGEALRATWERCMAPLGRFVEVGKHDLATFASLSMHPVARGVSFASGDGLYASRSNPALLSRILGEVAALAHAKAIEPPKPLHVYGFGQVEEAFRLMQGGKHIGKIVLRPEPGQKIPIAPDTRPQYHLRADATYVVAGGLGGLGQSVARWMVRRGAKHLLLLSRSGADKDNTLVADLVSMGAAVVLTPRCDVSNKQELAATLDACKLMMPPIAGCFNAQMVLKDDSFTSMSLDDFHAALAPKVKGSWNLHSLLPDGLDFFVMLSSMTGVMGSHGQSNYAAGNSYQDALARYRLASGQRAVSLDLGMLLSVGFVAQQGQDGNAALIHRLRDRGYMPIREAEFLSLIEIYCDPTTALPPRHAAGPLDVLHAQVITGIETPASLRRRGVELPFASRTSALFDALHHMGVGRYGDESGSDADAGGSGSADGKGGLKARLAAAASVAEAGVVVAEALAAKLARMLSVPSADVDMSRPLHVYGVDSLVAVELRNWLAREARADVAVLELMGGSNISRLGAAIAAKAQAVPGII